MDKETKESWLDNPVVQAVIVISAVVAFILILAWRLGGLKDFELGEYQEPTDLTEVIKNPDKYLSEDEVKIAGVLRQATDSADFIIVQDNSEMSVRPETGLHADDFTNRGEIGAGGKLSRDENGNLVLKAISFEVIDLDADAARARALLMADKIKPVLVESLELKQEDIQVIEAVELDWPNTSLGAAEPDKVYAQVLTKGYKIIFVSGKDEYEIHTNKEGSQAVLMTPRQELSLSSPDQQP